MYCICIEPVNADCDVHKWLLRAYNAEEPAPGNTVIAWSDNPSDDPCGCQPVIQTCYYRSYAEAILDGGRVYKYVLMYASIGDWPSTA